MLSEHRRDLSDPDGDAATRGPEVWSLDLVADDGSLGIIAELGIRPSEQTSWFWFCIAGPQRKLIALIDDQAAVPAAPGLELRAPGLWAEFCAQVDLDHFTVDLEAFGVELDEPSELLGAAYGRRVALGGELEWDTIAPVQHDDVGYEVACRVHGELLIDDQTIELDALGWRSHWWAGPRLNGGFRGFDGAGAPVSRSEPLERPSVGSVPTPAGLDHRLIIGPDGRGWWRG